MTLSLIHDRNDILKFAKLLDLQGETILFCRDRKKYGGSDKKEKILNTWIEEPRDFVEQVENLDFMMRNFLWSVSERDKFVMYSNTNCLDRKKAQKKFLRELLSATLNGEEVEIQRKWQSCLRRSRAEMKWYSIDLDTKEEKEFDFIRQKLKNPIIITTRGGYHFLVKQLPRGLPTEISVGNIDCPIPGTYQGGFKVEFYEDPDEFDYEEHLE